MFQRLSKVLVVFFCVSAAILLAANWWLTDYLASPIKLNRSLSIKVPAGTSLTVQAKQMEKEGLLKWPEVLTLYGRLSGQTGIKAGEYFLQPGVTPRDLLAKWVAGDVIQYSLTFPEGLKFSGFSAFILHSIECPKGFTLA